MEEVGLLGQLGINWKLFLSQAVNFFILLVILTLFVYKPLMKIVKERNAKIKEGLDKAEEASVRLKEVDNIAKQKINQADQESVEIIKKTEEKARVLDQNLTKKAEEHQEKLMDQINKNAKKAEEEANKNVLDNAADLVRKAIIKTVELDPDAVDDKLIKQAISEIKNEEIKSKIYAQALADLIVERKVEDKKIVEKFLELLEKNRDIKKIKEILALTENIFIKKTGRRKIIVETARHIKPKQREFVHSVAHKGDIISEKINKDLIAGIKIIINDNQLDISMKNKLSKIFL